MGYCIFVLRTAVCIPRENCGLALDAIKRLDPSDYYGVHGFANKSFAFVDGVKYQQVNALDEALLLWRWSTDYNDEGDLIFIGFEGEKLGDENILFEAIAPFVQNGSSIVTAGDDGRVWRWLFQNGCVSEQDGSVVFPAPP